MRPDPVNFASDRPATRLKQAHFLPSPQPMLNWLCKKFNPARTTAPQPAKAGAVASAPKPVRPLVDWSAQLRSALGNDVALLQVAKATDVLAVKLEAVQALAARWQALVAEFTGGDPATAHALSSMYQREPQLAARFGLDERLWAYVTRALATVLPAPAERRT